MSAKNQSNNNVGASSGAPAALPAPGALNAVQALLDAADADKKRLADEEADADKKRLADEEADADKKRLADEGQKGGAKALLDAVQAQAKALLDAVDTPISFTVAKGKAVTTRRGILSDGEEVFVRDFVNLESFQVHLRSGTVVEV